MTGDAAVVRRVMPAAPAAVYDEWLDADGLAEWLCPLPARVTAVECNVRVGGEFTYRLDDLGYEVIISGRYLELDRPRRIAFTWFSSAWSADYPETVVTITFEPHADGQTMMTINHSRLHGDVRDAHQRGWTAIAGELAARLDVGRSA